MSHNAPPAAAFAEAIRNKSGWLRRKYVVGLGVGSRIRAGAVQELETCLRVEVTDKLDSPGLQKAGRKPLPKFVVVGSHKIPVDVVEVESDGTGELQAGELQAGSVGAWVIAEKPNGVNSRGTLTAFVRSGSGVLHALCSGHVASGSDRITVAGVPGFGAVWTARWKASDQDQALAKWSVPLPPSTFRIAVLGIPPRPHPRVPDLGLLNRRQFCENAPATFPKVRQILRSVRIAGNLNHGMIETERVTAPGDSGCLLRDAEGAAIGMLVGARGASSYFLPCSTVFMRLPGFTFAQ